jgi:dTDP-4-amino-4,6-dideoxygalactose transaminase
MITTNDEELYKRLLKLRTHGITKDETIYENSVSFAGGDSGYPAWYMEMQELGYNYRLTDFQAALGLSQLQRADQGLQRRHEIAAYYHEAFKDIPQITDRNFESGNSQPPTANNHAHHLYVLEVEDRLGLYNYLRDNKIFAQIHYIPTHLMPYYRQFGWKEGDMPKAETYYKHCISLPMFPTLSDEDQGLVIDIITKYYQG